MELLRTDKKNLKRARLSPETKRDKVLSQFSVIKDTKKINELCEISDKNGIKIPYPQIEVHHNEK